MQQRLSVPVPVPCIVSTAIALKIDLGTKLINEAKECLHFRFSHTVDNCNAAIICANDYKTQFIIRYCFHAAICCDLYSFRFVWRIFMLFSASSPWRRATYVHTHSVALPSHDARLTKCRQRNGIRIKWLWCDSMHRQSDKKIISYECMINRVMWSRYEIYTILTNEVEWSEWERKRPERERECDRMKK